MRSSKLSLSSGAGSVSSRLAMYGYALASSLYCKYSKYGNAGVRRVVRAGLRTCSSTSCDAEHRSELFEQRTQRLRL